MPSDYPNLEWIIGCQLAWCSTLDLCTFYPDFDPPLGMGTAHLARFWLTISFTSTHTKKNMSYLCQIKNTGKTCDDDQSKKI